ncbi:MAG: class II aldolase/adducin family protein [Chloroflexi bacterium]|nr:class II aldolase/adducin family protein [Chloroflexota bacterium]
MNPTVEQIIYAGERLFERRLLDMCGGNISARDGDTIYITTRFSGSQRHWQNKAEDIISGHVDSDEIMEDPRFSREGKAHMAIYRNFPNVTGIIHAHPFHILPFCAAARPMEPVLEQTEKFGTIKVVKYAPAHGAELAQNIVDGLLGQDERIKKQAAAVIMPKHGIMVAGKHLMAAVDALERIDWNAYCILAQQSMPVQ